MKHKNRSYNSFQRDDRMFFFTLRRVLILIVCITGLAMAAGAQAQSYGLNKKYVVIDFEDGTATDTMGNIEADLLNGAWVDNDTERGGKVARFSSATRASLRLLTSPLNDTMTLSFWFKRLDGDPADPWRMIFAFIAEDGSDLYLTPRTAWNDKLYLISDNKPFSIYTGIPCAPAENKEWNHYTVVFSGNHVQVYQDGVLTGERTLIHTLSEMHSTQWYFINNPVKDFPMSGRLDELVIFHSALEENQDRFVRLAVQYRRRDIRTGGSEQDRL
jgi:basic membrane lipoprotein Med (substrate-binding protein (PBP1-ABC) superfamily)